LPAAAAADDDVVLVTSARRTPSGGIVLDAVAEGGTISDLEMGSVCCYLWLSAFGEGINLQMICI